MSKEKRNFTEEEENLIEERKGLILVKSKCKERLMRCVARIEEIDKKLMGENNA